MPVDSTSRETRRLKRLERRSAKKPRRRKGHKRCEMQEDISEHESDLDLDNDIRDIGGYVEDREDLVEHMFRSISKAKLRAMLPEILRPIAVDELKRLCVEEVEVMSKKRILRILDGENADVISSSGTDDSSLEEAGSDGEGATVANDGQNGSGSESSEYEEVIEYVEESGEESRDSDVEYIEEVIEEVEVSDSEGEAAVKETLEKLAEKDALPSNENTENHEENTPSETVKNLDDNKGEQNTDQTTKGDEDTLIGGEQDTQKDDESGEIDAEKGEQVAESSAKGAVAEEEPVCDTRRVVESSSLEVKQEKLQQAQLQKSGDTAPAVENTEGAKDAEPIGDNVKKEKQDLAYEKYTKQSKADKASKSDGLTKPEKRMRKKQSDDSPPRDHENVNSDMEEGEIQSSSESENEREQIQAQEQVVKFLSFKEKQKLKRQQKYAIFEQPVTPSQSENEDVVKQEPVDTSTTKKSKLQLARDQVKELELQLAGQLAADQLNKKRPERETIDHEAGKKIVSQSSKPLQDEDEDEADTFFGAETFQESNAEEDVASSSSESFEPDFDGVPDEREAMMSKREELVQKQHIGKRRALKKLKSYDKSKKTTSGFEEGTIAQFRQLKYGQFPLPKRPHKKQAGKLPPSFDLENFMNSHTATGSDKQRRTSSENRFENHPVGDIDVESYLRSHVDVCVSKPGEPATESSLDSSFVDSPMGDNKGISNDESGLEDEDDDLDIRRVIMTGVDEPEQQSEKEVTSHDKNESTADDETLETNETAGAESNDVKNQESANPEDSTDTDKEPTVVDMFAHQTGDNASETGDKASFKDTEQNVADVDNPANDPMYENNDSEQEKSSHEPELGESDATEDVQPGATSDDNQPEDDIGTIETKMDEVDEQTMVTDAECAYTSNNDVSETSEHTESSPHRNNDTNTTPLVRSRERSLERDSELLPSPVKLRYCSRDRSPSLEREGETSREVSTERQSLEKTCETLLEREALETASPHRSAEISTEVESPEKFRETSRVCESHDIASPGRSAETSQEGDAREQSRESSAERELPSRSGKMSTERDTARESPHAHEQEMLDEESNVEQSEPQAATDESKEENVGVLNETLERAVDLVEIGIYDDEFPEAITTKETDKRKDDRSETDSHKSKKKATHRHKKHKHSKDVARSKSDKNFSKHKNDGSKVSDDKERQANESSSQKHADKQEHLEHKHDEPLNSTASDNVAENTNPNGENTSNADQINSSEYAYPEYKPISGRRIKLKKAAAPTVQPITPTVEAPTEKESTSPVIERRSVTIIKSMENPKDGTPDKKRKSTDSKSETSTKKPKVHKSKKEKDGKEKSSKKSKKGDKKSGEKSSEKSKESTKETKEKKDESTTSRSESRKKRDQSRSQSKERNRARSRGRTHTKSRSRSKDDSRNKRDLKSRSRSRSKRDTKDRTDRKRQSRSRSRRRSYSKSRSKSSYSRSRSRSRSKRRRDSRSRSRRHRDSRSRSRSRSRRSRSRHRSHSRNRSRSRSRSRRRRHSGSRSRSRSRGRYHSKYDRHSQSGRSHMYADRDHHERDRDRDYQQDWHFDHPGYRGRGRFRGRYIRRPFGRGFHPGWGRGRMGFFQYHRQYFNPMGPRSELQYHIPPEVKKGKVPLSPLSKHLLMMHEHDSDSLDDDVRHNRRHDTDSDDASVSGSQSDSQSEYSDESEKADRRTKYRHKPMPSGVPSQIRDDRRHGGYQHHRGGSNPKRPRREQVYEVSSGDEAAVGGESDEGSEGQMEILELEMRARAIKAMLKAQEELDKAEKLRAHIKKKSPASAPSHRASTSYRSAKEVRTCSDSGGTKTKKKVIIRKVVKKKSKTPGLDVERQLAKDILEEATASTSGQLQGMKK